VNPADESKIAEPVNPADESKIAEPVNPADESKIAEPVNPADESKTDGGLNPADESNTAEPVNPADESKIAEKLIIDKDLKNTFSNIYQKYREETINRNSLVEYDNFYYKAIIDLGWEVVPIIIDRLRKEHSCMFVALSTITHIHLINTTWKWNIKECCQKWIEWWDKDGKYMYIEKTSKNFIKEIGIRMSNIERLKEWWFSTRMLFSLRAIIGLQGITFQMRFLGLNTGFDFALPTFILHLPGCIYDIFDKYASVKIGKHKTIRVQSATSGFFNIGFDIQCTMHRHHPSFSIDLHLLYFNIYASITDSRYWDYETNTLVKGDSFYVG
jgi:hypothetical protein